MPSDESPKRASRSNNVAGSGPDRPFAESKAPDGCRVDLCTAQAEWLRALDPDGPQPVFSSLALIHGTKAPAASRLRTGFALSSSMDLAWSLGFPRIAFIVDGVPPSDTTAALIELYGAEGKGQYGFYPLQASFGRLYPRRAAAARMYELDPYPADVTEEEKAEYAAHIFELPDDEHDEATVLKDYSDDDLARSLAFSARQERLDEDVLLLEALCGPDRILRGLSSLLEAGNTKAYAVVSAACPLFLRADAEVGASVRSKMEAWASGQDSATDEAVKKWLHVDETVRTQLAAGKIYQQYFPYVSEALRQEVTNAAVKEPTPYLRFALTGDLDRMLPALIQNLAKFEDLDVDISFLRELSSLNHPGILPAMLKAGARPHSRPTVDAWFAAHGSAFASALTDLARGSGAIAKLAKERVTKLAGA